MEKEIKSIQFFKLKLFRMNLPSSKKWKAIIKLKPAGVSAVTRSSADAPSKRAEISLIIDKVVPITATSRC